VSSANYYDKLWGKVWGDAQIYGPSHRIHWKILHKLLSPLSFKTALDIGCGNGATLSWLNNNWPEVKSTGVDCSDTALKQLAKILPDVSVSQMDITTGSLPENFNLVLCLDVLEHIQDDDLAIENLAKMSNKYVVISSLQGNIRNFEKNIGHVRNYAHGELQKKLTQAGLRIDRVVEWGWPFFSPLYRDFLDRWRGQQLTFGSFGFFRRLACHLVYFLFRLNSSKRGDMIFILARKTDTNT
jgi:SAM-dependent methyltransferase